MTGRDPGEAEPARRGSRAVRAVRTSAGLALVATGTALLVLPGPGLLMIGAGVALIPGGREKLERAREVLEPRARELARYVDRWIERRRAA